MGNQLADAISPYLRSHADNPVAWRQWGHEPFEEAARRDVPVLVSIGYATCHWCHVMARESFSDPELADYLNANFVAVKVDREEHPDVDAGYLAAAGAFTQNLGWPLNVFVNPSGGTFYAGTYWPPRTAGGHVSFRQVLEAVVDAWTNRRGDVDAIAAALTEAITTRAQPSAGDLPELQQLDDAVRRLAEVEDAQFGGFGAEPKFPVAPVLNFLVEHGSGDALPLAQRTLTALAGSGLRDPVEGGFFRYATRRDWTDPHYERMLYDNAQLLRAYALLSVRSPASEQLAREVAEGIAGYLLEVLRLPTGAFASAQDSESIVDGKRVEGDYYRLDAEARAGQLPPALDEKVLTGWNGLAIEALALAGFHLDRQKWVDAARAAADHLLASHLRGTHDLLRASANGRPSDARATLEDYGMLASGLLQLSLATGEVRYAEVARTLVDACIDTDGEFVVPGGGDPVLQAQGLTLVVDPSEGAYPSGVSAMASAAHALFLLTADARHRDASIAAMRNVAEYARQQPMGFGTALAVMGRFASPSTQLVVVASDGLYSDGGGPPDARAGAPAVDTQPMLSFARRWFRQGGVCAVVSADQAEAFARSGFELFEGRVPQHGAATAYLCHDFVCRLPVTDPTELASA